MPFLLGISWFPWPYEEAKERRGTRDTDRVAAMNRPPSLAIRSNQTEETCDRLITLLAEWN